MGTQLDQGCETSTTLLSEGDGGDCDDDAVESPKQDHAADDCAASSTPPLNDEDLQEMQRRELAMVMAVAPPVDLWG